MLDDVADAWHKDITAGHRTLVVTDTAATAADLSAACQQRLHDRGALGGHVGTAADSNPVHIGDQIQTRQNTRNLATSDGHRVLNRDVWTITGTTDTGGILARHTHSDRRVTITPDYLNNNVVLAYATTLAGAQGRTVDRGHVLITPRTTAASVYVGMTRGRTSNTAHVVTNSHDHDELDLGHRTPTAAFADAVTRTPDNELSATTIASRWRATTGDRREARSNDHRYRTSKSPTPPCLRR